MDKCVLDGRDRRLRCMFEMAGWRCLRCLGKATADGVWPAVGHCQGVIGFRRDGDTLGISLDVARVCELVGVDAGNIKTDAEGISIPPQPNYTLAMANSWPDSISRRLAQTPQNTSTRPSQTYTSNSYPYHPIRNHSYTHLISKPTPLQNIF